MELTAFQTAELRDSDNNIVQEGSYGKTTALANATNTGWIDYVMNNLEVLYNTIGGENVIDLSLYLKIEDAEVTYQPVGQYVTSVNGTSPNDNGNVTISIPSYGVATSSTTGLVKGGGNVSVAADGTMTASVSVSDVSGLDLTQYALATDIPTDYVSSTTLTNTLSNYALTTDIPDVTGYLRSSTASNTYLTIADAAATYQPFGSYALATDLPDMTLYLSTTDAANTYLSQTDAETYYLRIGDAATTYQPIGDYVTSVNNELPDEDGNVTIIDIEGNAATATTASSLAHTLTINNTAFDGTADVTLTISGGGSSSGTVTQVLTGIGLTGGPVTTTGTIKANLKSETAHTASSATPTNTTGRQYAVGVDADGYLSVNVPWTDTDTTYADMTAAEVDTIWASV